MSVVEDGRVVHTFDDATQPGGVAAVGERIAELPAGDGPTHAFADARGRILVADSRGDAILTFGLDPQPRRLGRHPLPGRPYGLAFDPVRNRLWVTLTETNEVVGLDVSGREPRVVTQLPTLRQSNTVAVNDTTGRVFVASPAERVLQLVDPGS